MIFRIQTPGDPRRAARVRDLCTTHLAEYINRIDATKDEEGDGPHVELLGAAREPDSLCEFEGLFLEDTCGALSEVK